MVVPRLFLCRTAHPRRPDVISLRESSTAAAHGRKASQFSRWTRPVSLGGSRCCIASAGMSTPSAPDGALRDHAFNAPQRHFNRCHPGLFRPVLAPRKSPFRGQTSPSPAASTGRRSGHFRTLLGVTGGTQTHSRRTGRKLGQLRCARQGLVRVPESNTKYGGNVGENRGNAAPVIEPSISESSGIPKLKKFARGLWMRRFTPAVHRASIYSR